MENYLQYLNNSPTVFFKCVNDSNFTVEFLTENVKEIFEYSTEDFISKKVAFADLIHKEDKKQVLKEIEFFAKSSVDRFEFKPYRLMTKSKKVLWVQDITKLIRNDKGEILYFYCYITDITNQKKINEKLNVTEGIIKTIFDNSFQFIGLMKPDGTLIKANKTSLEFVHVKEGDVIGKKFWDCPWWEHSKKEQKILQKEISEASKGKFINTSKTHYDDLGNKIYVDFSIKPVFNNKNEVIYLIPEGRNVTENILKQKQLNRYLDIVNENVLISTTDLEGKIIDCSEKFKKATGFSESELIGNKHNIMKHDDSDNTIFEGLWNTIIKGEIWRGEHKNITKNGKTLWVENVITPNYDENNEINAYTSIYSDITLRKEISDLLITDSLTNIYNRRHFNTIFKSEFKRCRRHKKTFVLFMIDIDYFKQYNDTYGHQEGDLALVQVANCMKNIIKRPEDYIFRLGGEEFCILTSDISEDGVLTLANHIKNSVEDLHIVHSKNECSDYLTISIGIKIVKNDYDCDYEEIYKFADDALYEAKRNGRNSICIKK